MVDAANIFDPTPPLTAVNAGTFATTLGGVVTLNADGSFLYTTPVGFTGGDDDFVVDAGASGTAAVTITVTNLVWFVDNTEPPGGLGLSYSPFSNLQAAESTSGIDHYIFVHFGDGTTTGLDDLITLKERPAPNRRGRRAHGPGCAWTHRGSWWTETRTSRKATTPSRR